VVEFNAEDNSMKMSTNTAGTIVLTYFGVIFMLLFAGAVAIVDDAVSEPMQASLYPENTAGLGTSRDVDLASPALPLNLTPGNDNQLIATPPDFPLAPLPRDLHFVPDRFEGRGRGNQP
jgi:hypothetical protein